MQVHSYVYIVYIPVRSAPDPFEKYFTMKALDLIRDPYNYPSLVFVTGVLHEDVFKHLYLQYKERYVSYCFDDDVTLLVMPRRSSAIEEPIIKMIIASGKDATVTSVNFGSLLYEQFNDSDSENFILAFFGEIDPDNLTWETQIYVDEIQSILDTLDEVG